MVIKKGRYLPALDKRRCNRCGLCHESCPGHGVDFESLNAELLGDIPEENALGRYLACYVGHACDPGLRHDAASGGLVSSLLIFALEQGLIDGALVTRMRRDDPLTPEPFIARTREEILSAAGSKYCPVAAGTALQEILSSKGQFAVVGLPCHIQGLRKAEQQIPTLSKRIRYRISIPCSLNYSFRGTTRFLKSRGIAPRDVDALQYRGRGWPGSMWIRAKDGCEYTIPLAQYFQQLRPYAQWRCTLCSDMMGELSDLTCGDAWIPEVVRTDKAGTSFVVSRTSEGEELLEHAASSLAVELSELEVRDLLACQGHALFKKRQLKARMSLLWLVGESVPMYRQNLPAPSRADYLESLKFYVARYILSGRHPILRGLFHLARRLKRALPKARAPQVESMVPGAAVWAAPDAGRAAVGQSSRGGLVKAAGLGL
jgi:coenzyme F420 hydrogenase subunit beta